MALAQAAFERGNHDGDILSMMLASAAESGNGIPRDGAGRCREDEPDPGQGRRLWAAASWPWG